MPANTPAALVVSSPAFVPEGVIPAKYTCDGEGINPPLIIDQVPEGTRSLALIVEDPDAPASTYDHWLLWDILPANSIEENTEAGVSGVNSAGKTGYYPPCPPTGFHRYYFHVFAVDSSLDLRPGADKTALIQAMQPHILAMGTLMGRYRRLQR